MSLRSLFRDFRPLFRVLDEPLTRSPVYFSRPGQGLFDDPFFQLRSAVVRPPVDVIEEGNAYIVEAELPGVQKDNVEVRIGDGGRSLTIEGKIVAQRPEPTGSASASTSGEGGSEGTCSCISYR
jgi:HSP20 family molecular chaperone IbpA